MIYVYGAASFGEAVGSELIEAKTNFEFIDKFCHHRTLLGVPVKRPEEVTAKISDIVYVTAATLALEDNTQKNIIDIVAGLGFKNIKGFKEIDEDFPNAFKKLASQGTLWRSYGNPLKPIWDNEKCSQIRASLCDHRSIELFDNIENFRKTPSFKTYIWPDIGREYVDAHIPNFPSNQDMHVIDLGTWIGDTLKEFSIRYAGRIKSYHCFEPDPQNIVLLNKQIEELADEKIEIFLHPYATGSERGTVRFSGGTGSSSHISDNGELEVEVAVIDEIITDSTINYIKFDIEGAELETIKGAEKLISAQRPDMAISLYHRPEDIWEIPLKVKEIVPDYNFYLRQHHHMGAELTLYATCF